MRIYFLISSYSYRYAQHLIILITLSFSLSNIHAQVLNGKSTFQNIFDTTIENKLVELATKGPQINIAKHQNKIDEYQLKKARNSWLNLLIFSININEFTFSDQTNIFFPKYNASLNVPLGTIFSKTAIKSAREQVEIGKANVEQSNRTIKTEVISKYRQYIIISEQLYIQSQVTDDAQSTFIQTELKFKDNAVSIEVYRAVSKLYSEEQQKTLSLKLQQEFVKLQIEELIGTSLESVLNKPTEINK